MIGQTPPPVNYSGYPIKKVLLLALRAGEIILRSGAETSRVEETVNILVAAFGIQGSHTFVTPTAIYVSIDLDTLDYPLTFLRRVRSRTLNYSCIAAVNDLSRRAAQGKVGLDEALAELDGIDSAPDPYPFWLRVWAGAGSAAGATLLLGGGVLDVLPAFFTTILVQLVRLRLEKWQIPTLFGDFFGATIATAIALLLAWLGLPIQTNLVIAGGIIQLVPGAALMACVQDGISGDLISSAARGLEAFLKGAAIACGVGLSLSVALALGYYVTFSTTTGEVWQIPIQVGAAFVAAACHGVNNYVPRFAILTAGLIGGFGWFVYILIIRFNSSALIATFVAAFVVGLGSWVLARWQHSPITLYILPGILPLLPGLTIYRGMLELTQNQGTVGILLLIQATFLGGALAAGVALSNSLVRRRTPFLVDRRR